MMTKEHKHAAVLRAIADGVPLSEFEVRGVAWTEWHNMEAHGGYRDWMASHDSWEIRRKPQHIIVNGFKVPKPLDAMPIDGEVFTPHLQSEKFFDCDWFSSSWALRSFKRGIAHSTKEAAAAHAKAMLGIDPEEV